jgi:hypothetical protein
MINVEPIIDLDDYLQSGNLDSDLLDDELDDENSPTKKSKVPVEKKKSMSEEFNLSKTTDAVSKHAKEKLRLYLKKSPQYKILDQQFKFLSEEFFRYKQAGRTDLCDKTQQMLKEITESKNKFTKLYKNANWKNTKAISTEKIENSELLKELKTKRLKLEAEFKKTNPVSIIKTLREYRKMFDINDTVKNDKNVIDFDDDFDEMLDATSNDNKLVQDYHNFVGYIADLIDDIPLDVMEMTLNEILTELRKVIPTEKIQALKDGIESVKMEASNEINKLNGNEDITNIIFEIFDFETDSEEKPKEMLAASNVEYVKSIAYNACSKLNMLHYIDDAIAYGLMGLSIAIDKWYKIQKMKDSVVSFNGFANTYISMNIKKGLYELSSGGTINKNSLATLVYNRKKQFEGFIKLNPELKDVPSDLLETMLDGLLDYVPGAIITESTYSDIVGGDGEQNADIWSNATISDMNDDKFLECKMEYENLLKSIKLLFGMFEMKTDSATGEKSLTKFKLFNKYDYKLFKLQYGLEFKQDLVKTSNSKANNNYTQEEMRFIMQDYYAQNGQIVTFKQEAISYRITELNKKIKATLDDHPELKAGFEYIYTYWRANSENMELLSNSLEDIDMKSNRDSMKTKYNNNSAELDKKLSDGKRLNDVYQTNPSNPLDSQIANMFRNW